MSLSASCAYCQLIPASSRCSRCLVVYYCKVECQRFDWKRHKKECRRYAENDVSDIMKVYKQDVKRGVGPADDRLFKACTVGRLGAVQEILAEGVNVNARDRNGYTPLLISCQRGYVEVAKALIAAGADIDHANNDGDTALMFASLHGNMIAVRILLDAGAEVNRTNNNGFSPLMFASGNGHTEVVRVLIAAGADVSYAPVSGPVAGYTALDMAANDNYTDVVDLLLEASSDRSSR